MQEVVQRLCDIQDRNPDHRVALVMVDIDHFKSVNDTHGQNQGDVVLGRVAAEILDDVRSSDIPVRLGGEEFAIFLADDVVAEAAKVAERLRKRVARLRFAAPMERQIVTVSIGVAIRQPRESLLDLIQRADVALYEAKDSGRNRVCVAPKSTV